MLCGSWPCRGFKQLQGLADNGPLHVSLPGFSAGIPQREVGKEESGHTAVFDDIDGGSQDHGGYAVGLQKSCDQTHGLVTDGSQRDQQGNVDLVFLTHLQDFRPILFIGFPLAV